MLSGPKQDAEHADEMKPDIRGASSCVAIVEEHHVRALLDGERDGFRLADMESGADFPWHSLTQRGDAQPAVVECGGDQGRGGKLPKSGEFLPDSRRHEHSAELVAYQSEPSDDGEI